MTRERRATFRQRPGSAAARPGTATRAPGLFLVSAWTDTGWPDTMEGAVRSGLTAARLVRRHLEGAGPVSAVSPEPRPIPRLETDPAPRG